MIVAIDVLKWPGMNVQFIVAFVGTVGLTLAAIPYGKRRPVGSPLTWGQAMLAATYVFALFFLAYGIVPHQWLTHEQNQLNWRADRIWVGHTATAEVWHASFLPFDVTFQAECATATAHCATGHAPADACAQITARCAQGAAPQGDAGLAPKCN